MHLLQLGVPLNVIALWLGHTSAITTHRCAETSLAMKKVLARLENPRTRINRFRVRDSLMQLLRTLSLRIAAPALTTDGAANLVAPAHSLDLRIGVESDDSGILKAAIPIGPT